jgi:hypothetical protein
MSDMTALAPILLALAGGASLALQYAVMLAVTERGVGVTSALLINSVIGLIVLGGIETYRGGPQFVIEIVARARLWFVVPGLLGTFFVFAGLLWLQASGGGGGHRSRRGGAVGDGSYPRWNGPHRSGAVHRDRNAAWSGIPRDRCIPRRPLTRRDEESGHA